MKKKYLLFFPFTWLIFSACVEKANKEIVSQRYVHKYGYDVSKEEWQTELHPGQILTTLRDGKTIVEPYEDGILHGQKTETYPHSQTIHFLEQYERGRLVKRITYNIRGIPEQEALFKTNTHIVITHWYPSGTPKLKEEYKEDLLVNGQYFNLSNEADSRIDQGRGEKMIRNQNGDILAKERFDNYQLIYTETYYPNNMPHRIIPYKNGSIHGEKKEFAMTGEPVYVENYSLGKKHGPSTYYQSGYKYLESFYINGLKEGMERYYIDGEIIAEETEYQGGAKHGPSIVYCDGSAKTVWYFENQKVSKSTYEKLIHRHDLIMSAQQNN